MHSNATDELQLYKSNEVPVDRDVAAMIEGVRWWAETYLTNPHPDLGRSGAVCPFTKASLEKDMFWVGATAEKYTSADDLVTLIGNLASQFRDLPGAEGKAAVFKTTLVLLPNVTDYALIDAAHEKLKSDFITEGLMIGQFYPGCEVPGLWNPLFRPLDAPMPMLVVRHMVATDFPFLVSRIDWIEVYLRKFAPALPSVVRNAITEQFDEVA